MISHLKKTRTQQYPAESVTNTDYADDQALLSNTSVQTETQLHSLDRTVGGMHLKQVATSPLSGKPLKLIDQLMYLKSDKLKSIAQSAGAVEYTDYFSAGG